MQCGPLKQELSKCISRIFQITLPHLARYVWETIHEAQFLNIIQVNTLTRATQSWRCTLESILCNSSNMDRLQLGAHGQIDYMHFWIIHLFCSLVNSHEGIDFQIGIMTHKNSKGCLLRVTENKSQQFRSYRKWKLLVFEHSIWHGFWTWCPFKLWSKHTLVFHWKEI